MKTLVMLLINLTFLSLTAQEASYQINQAESKCAWTGYAAVGNYELGGTLEAKKAKLVLENGSIKSGQIIFQMKSIQADIKDLEHHLKGPDFFAVKKFPQAQFEIEQQVLNDGEVKLVGQLTLKGLSQEETIPVIIEQVPGGIRIKGVAKIDRTKYGITYNSVNFFKNLGDQAIADEFKLNFDLLFES